MPSESFVPFNFAQTAEPANHNFTNNDFPSADEIARALRERQFVPYFQLQYHYPSHRVSGVEVLSRWFHPERGFVVPGFFIPQMEADGTIYDLDLMVWDKACAQLRAWLDMGINLPSISVNMSRATMMRECIPQIFSGLVEKYGLRPDMLHIEITESAFNAGHEKILADIDALQRRGFIVEMDDFGSGYSSLSFLKDAPVDVLKLDMAFLQNTRNKRRGRSILSSMVRLAYDLNLHVIAEGVETLAQAEFLKSIGCYNLQGYFFARPMAAGAVTEILRQDGVIDISAPDTRGGIENAIDFLDDGTQSALLFNSFVGGAYILEYRGDSLTILRCNDRFYKEMGIDPARTAEPEWDLFRLMTDDSRAAYIGMLERAVRTGTEADCNVCTNEPREADRMWTHVRARYLARRVDSYLFYISVENITERVNLDRRNSDLMAELTALANNIPGGIARFRVRDGSLACEYMSEGFHRMRGFDRDELMALLNDPVRCTVHPDDEATVRDAIDRVYREHMPVHTEFRALCKNGEYMWVDINGVLGAHPRDNYLYVYCEDITERRSLRSSLSESRRQLGNAVNAISGGTAVYEIIDGKMHIVDVSEGAAAITGLSREEFMTAYRGDPMYGILPQDLPAARQSLTDMLNTGKDAIITFRVRNKSGSIVWARSHSHIDIAEDGRVMLYIVFTNLSSSASLYLSVLNEIRSAILVTSRDTYEVLYVNDRMANLAGMPAEDMLGMHCYECCGKCGLPCDECRERADTGELRYNTVANNRRYDVRRKSITWNGIDAMITYMADITDSYNANLRVSNLVKHLPGGVSVFREDENGKIIRSYANNNCARMLGYDDYTYAKGPIERDLKYVFEEDLPGLKQVIAEAMQTRSRCRAEFRVCLRGDTRYLRMEAEPFLDPTDNVQRYFALYTDITEQKLGAACMAMRAASVADT